MLTLADASTVGAFSVYRDVVYDGGVRGTTPRFYAIAAAPRLARDDDGGPALRFVRYRGLAPGKDGAAALHAGGLVTLTLDLGPRDDERAALRAAIGARYGVDAAAVELADLPVREGRATLSIGGEGPGASAGGAAPELGGSVDVALGGASRVTFAVPVTQDGAALLAAALDGGEAVLFAALAIEFEHRLDGVSLHVWCDADRAAAAAAARRAAGAGAAPKDLAASLVASRAAGIEVESAAPLPGDEAARLEELGQELLADALAATVAKPDDGAPAPATDARLVLNHTFTASYPATARAAIDGPIAVQVTGDARAAREIDVDLAGAAFALDVTAVCPADFAGGLVDAAHVYVVYEARGEGGDPFRRETDFVLKDGAARKVFRIDASPSTRTYRWRATVTYKDGTTADVPERSTDATVLVVDVGLLGVVAVDVSLADVPLAAVTRAVVDLEVPSRGLTHQVVLDGASPSATWQVVAGDATDCRYRVAWILADGRRIDDGFCPAPPGGGGPRRIFLDAPRDAVRTRAVTAIAAADFTDVAQVLVELRSSAEDRTVLAFTAAGQTTRWTPDIEPGAPLKYQARRTVIDRDGTTASFDPTEEDSPFLVVRDVTRFEVQIVARLLDLGGAWTLALVALAYDDDATARHVQEVVTIRDRTEEPIWRVRVGAPDRHRYRHQLTLVAKDGTRRVGIWEDAADEILVLSPPAETS